MKSQTELVIFDCDGVLIDSEWAHRQARCELAEVFGLPQNACEKIKPGYSCWSFWSDFIDNPHTVQQLTAMQFNRALQLLIQSDIAPSPGLTDLLHALKLHGYATAVASGSSASFVHGLLIHYNLSGYFDVVLCGEHVRRLKPAPDIFNHCMAQLGITPQHTIVIEDSDSGCHAAKEANCACLAYSRYSSDTESYRDAEQIFDSMEAINAYLANKQLMKK